MHVIVVAEKGKNSTSDLNPIQMQYLDENSTDWRLKYFEFQKSKRKFFNENPNSYSKHFPSNYDHIASNLSLNNKVSRF